MPTIEQIIQAETISEIFALIYTPSRRRKRFPANCVYPMESEQQAREQADSDKNLHPAKVCGPSKSSEGVMIYYLSQWIDLEP